MTTPNVPLRMELAFELPATPEQVWEAIATANGISAWFLPTDLEERRGGVIVTHMGPDDSSPGRVTGWDPPRRFAYEEPDWARLAGNAGANVTPLASEFLIEARSGGTSVLRIVTSAFGTGADWEREFFEGMEQGWRPYFDRLRLYLAHFPGQRVTPLSAFAVIPGSKGAVWSAMRQGLGFGEVGEAVDARGLTGHVERTGKEDILVRLTGPVPGFLAFGAWGTGGDSTTAVVQGQLFSKDAAAFVQREQPAWQAWLDNLQAVAV